MNGFDLSKFFFFFGFLATSYSLLNLGRGVAGTHVELAVSHSECMFAFFGDRW